METFAAACSGLLVEKISMYFVVNGFEFPCVSQKYLKSLSYKICPCRSFVVSTIRDIILVSSEIQFPPNPKYVIQFSINCIIAETYTTDRCREPGYQNLQKKLSLASLVPQI